MGRACGTIGEKRIAYIYIYYYYWESQKERDHLGDKELGPRSDIDWIGRAQNGYKCSALVNAGAIVIFMRW
jgi:hypothetical protein